ncbi:DUF5071 domain-containing protein, partial [Rhizobium leguminosarum]|uniref:DUF5071 domain-containing protein n=1 Tax=Rhizobium leguminosarum TaxID=384 RepID=UPI003F9AC8A7
MHHRFLWPVLATLLVISWSSGFVCIRYASEEASVILDDLLAWTADGNWPVAQPLARFIVTLGTPIVDPLLRVLRGNDSSQK